ncbi:XVIPCD domain-containing protein [Xanthomonas arboricola]|uniref:XVIPCD domain-containing protein n=1 Tax=Xanthomonas arboricola TaxID=56448 RepID=UPI002DD63706|nr:XVIPCD domain-containing protein [Xanthomonas arboricola]NIK44413.1 hypothetical protein [Xanthomonas arboricola]
MKVALWSFNERMRCRKTESGSLASQPDPDFDRQPPEVCIDLKSLGPEPRQLERNGLDLGSAPTFNPIDISRDGYGMVQLKETGARSNGTANLAAPAAPGPSLMPADAGQPDHAMHQQIRSEVEQLDATNGRTFDAPVSE